MGAKKRRARLDLGAIDALALARAVAMEQCGHYGGRAGDARHEVGVLRPCLAGGGGSVGMVPQMSDAGQRQQVGAIRDVMGVGSAAAETLQPDQDDVWLDLAQLLVAHPPAFHHAQAEVLDYHVAVGDQVFHELLATLGLEVDREALLVAAELGEVGLGVPALRIGAAAVAVAAQTGFDL